MCRAIAYGHAQDFEASTTFLWLIVVDSFHIDYSGISSKVCDRKSLEGCDIQQLQSTSSFGLDIMGSRDAGSRTEANKKVCCGCRLLHSLSNASSWL